MCGIAGIVAYGADAPPVDGDELLAIRDAMAARGPDGAGTWVSGDKRVGLAHRRLAIIDVGASGSQPMSTQDSRLHVTFNGEIYNYRELRRELVTRGYQFRSNSDTEVLLHLYSDRGARMVQALRGMFAFAIWDDRNQELFVARDPFGIKPLYYADNGRTLRFASQVKALLKSEVIDAAEESAGAVGFLLWGHLPEPYTFYKGIRSLPAGSHLLLSNRAISTTRYFDVAEEFRSAQERPAARTDASEELRTALSDSVRHHLVSDVPVGLFLSAGVDSGAIAAAAAAAGGTELRAITLGFHEFLKTANDEVPVAKQVAEHVGLSHQIDWIRRDDFNTELPRILAAMDQPTIDGVNTYFVSRAAKRAGLKVALSGLGGDELFGGYPSFRQVPALVKAIGFTPRIRWLRRLVRRVAAALLPGVVSPKYAGTLEYGSTYGGAYLLRRAVFMPWEVSAIVGPSVAEEGLEQLQVVDTLDATIRGVRSSRARITILEMSWYMKNQLLRDSDWAGMAHSVEIRVPFVDVDLFRALAPRLASEHPPTKSDVARSMSGSLPPHMASRRKTGFVTPVSRWISEQMPGRPERGLRQWALHLSPQRRRTFKTLALVTDAYGGLGGIAKFNRDLLKSIASVPESAEVVAIPRVIRCDLEPIPTRVTFAASAAGSKARFAIRALTEFVTKRFDVVVVGHINLSPLVLLLRMLKRVPCVLVVHGIDAWSRPDSRIVRMAVQRMSLVVGVSQVTLDRFTTWSGVDPRRHRLLPNCVDLHTFTPAEKCSSLSDRLRLTGRVVIMTLGRLESRERFKGFDEVLEAMPALARVIPDISYLICGDGNDRNRLERKAEALGVRDRVVFAGYVPEHAKPDYYRLADAYVMPSRGEGFGIVFLEALACGIPVMGSVADGGRDALRGGALGCLVDPESGEDVIRGVLQTLARKKERPAGLNDYSQEAFADRMDGVIRQAFLPPPLGSRRPEYVWPRSTEGRDVS